MATDPDDEVGQFYGAFSDLPHVDPPPTYVGNWLRRGTYTTLFARAGMGKTVIAAELVHCLRDGSRFLGQDVNAIGDDPNDVLWVNGDLRLWQIHERLRSFRGESGKPDKVLIWQALQTCLLENMAALLERACTAKVVFFDHRGTLFRLQDANAAENWTAMNDALIALCDAGVAVVMLTHESKTGSGAFGSSAQEWPVDTMIKIGSVKPTKKEEDRAFDLGVTIPPYEAEWTKCRLCARPEPVPFRIDIDVQEMRLRPVWKDYIQWNAFSTSPK